jgi:hypothetical protein
MLDLAGLFIGTACAQTMSLAAQTPNDTSDQMGKYIPIVIIGVAVYFLFFHKKKR